MASAAKELNVAGKRILVIIPDGTRTMPMPLLFEMLQQEIGTQAAACDYLVALGTHPLMRDAQLSALVGQPVINGVCGASRVTNHRWDLPETFAELGVIPRAEVARISCGLMDEPIPVRINRDVLDYDQVLICGPVFPHEVVGFSGGNKYLFPGIGGPEMIGQTHWLGALLGSYELIGTPVTPVREMIKYGGSDAEDAGCVPGTCGYGRRGCRRVLWLGYRGLASGSRAIGASTHRVGREPFQRVLSVMPTIYDDLWTAAKGMYKVEPALADGGEVVIYAPHINEVSYTHGADIDRIGYHCSDYILQQWERFKNAPRSVLAHSTHLRGKGTYDAEPARRLRALPSRSPLVFPKNVVATQPELLDPAA